MTALVRSADSSRMGPIGRRDRYVFIRIPADVRIRGARRKCDFLRPLLRA
jgi:hypothetical protein